MNQEQGSGTGPGYGQFSSQPAGFGRFTKHIILGAVFGGVLSGIPLLSALNCLFCILNIAGIALALSMYLKENPGDNLTNGEAAIFGAAAGGGAGLIMSILGLILGPLVMRMMYGFLVSLGLPPMVTRQMGMQSAWGILAIPINIIVYAGFGALGAWLAMLLLFKDRLRQ